MIKDTIVGTLWGACVVALIGYALLENGEHDRKCAWQHENGKITAECQQWSER